MSLKKLLLPWPWLFAFLALAGHLLIQMKFFTLPLIEDEGYYSNPAVLQSLLNWYEYSFGHPPGWHYLHGLLYTIFGLKAEVVRGFGFSFSTALLLLLLALGWWRKQLLTASVLMLMVACHEYVRDFGSFNHPVIATSVFGFAGLFLMEQKKWLAASIALTAAIMIRESALVFVVASLFFVDSKKQLRFLGLPFGLLLVIYVWYFISKGGVLMNGQVNIMLQSGQSPFTLSLDKLGNHVQLILQLFPASFLVLALLGVPAVHASGRFRWTPMSSALITVFFLHAGFFGLYTELGLRITFIAAMALCFLVFHWLETEPEKLWVKPLVLMSAGILTAFQLFHWIETPTDRYRKNRDIVKIHQISPDLLHPLVQNNTDLIIVASNPYHEYLMFPHMGYTNESLVVHWYGGSPGYMKLPDFDVGLVHVPTDQWPEQDILKHATENNFELYHEVAGQYSTLQIWVRPGIKP